MVAMALVVASMVACSALRKAIEDWRQETGNRKLVSGVALSGHPSRRRLGRWRLLRVSGKLSVKAET